jgi:ElaB/YqjD/DUF883 family membrane-anchored ribosome-binding protein
LGDSFFHRGICYVFFERITIMEKTISNTGNGSEAVGTIQRQVETAGAALHSGIDKVADPARSAVDRLSNTAHQTVDKLASTANTTVGRIADKTRRFTDMPVQALDTSKSWVQNRPLEAVAAALALGFVFGRLTAR